MSRRALGFCLAVAVCTVPTARAADFSESALSLPMLRDTAVREMAAPEPPPLRLSERLADGPFVSMAAAFDAQPDELEAMATWNREHRMPARNGISRRLAQPLELRLPADGLDARVGGPAGGGWLARSGSALVWGTSVEVSEAYRLRLELRDLALPAGARLWVWGEGDEPIAFDPALADDSGALWTPSVTGPVVHLEISWPESGVAAPSASLRIDRALELFALDAEGRAQRGGALPMATTGGCLLDAACFSDAQLPGIGALKKSVALLQYVEGGSAYTCTGNLLNNSQQNFIPYLLTANHCIDSHSVASSVEAFWDYIQGSCLGSAPPLGSLPRSSGATLLATGAGSDFTLLRLNSAPGGRTFLGWNASGSAVTNGMSLPRLHHPLGFPMSLSQSVAWTPSQTCGGLPTSQFLYSDPRPESNAGTVVGGSSGSAVMRPDGQVVGQLYGWCGPNLNDTCTTNSQDSAVDGRFQSSFGALSGFLNPVVGAPCVANSTTACLLGNRYKVQVRWTDFQNVTRDAFLASSGTPESALFYFVNSNNWEFLIKAIDGCGLNNRRWIFFAAATNVGYQVTVTDTQSGAPPKVYSNALGNLAQAINDIEAFGCN